MQIAAMSVHQERQIRTFTLRAPLHKNTVGLLALGHNQGATKAANYANVSVDNRAPTRRWVPRSGSDGTSSMPAPNRLICTHSGLAGTAARSLASM
jgi:hypothetical protein